MIHTAPGRDFHASRACREAHAASRCCAACRRRDYPVFSAVSKHLPGFYLFSPRLSTPATYAGAVSFTSCACQRAMKATISATSRFLCADMIPLARAFYILSRTAASRDKASPRSSCSARCQTPQHATAARCGTPRFSRFDCRRDATIDDTLLTHY